MKLYVFLDVTVSMWIFIGLVVLAIASYVAISTMKQDVRLTQTCDGLKNVDHIRKAEYDKTTIFKLMPEVVIVVFFDPTTYSTLTLKEVDDIYTEVENKISDELKGITYSVNYIIA